MTLRVLGIDPGLTRCGVGIVDVSSSRVATLVHVDVIRTPPDMALEERLLGHIPGHCRRAGRVTSRPPLPWSACSRNTTSAQ